MCDGCVLGLSLRYGRIHLGKRNMCLSSSYIWVWKSEAVVYSLILLVTLGPTWDEEHRLGCRVLVEDGAVGWSCKCSSGRHCRRIGGHQTTTWRLASCSLSRGHNLRLASPGPRIQAARGLEFCVLGIVVHLRLGLFANTNACICDSDAVSGIDKDAFMLFALDLIGSGSHK